MNLDRRIRILSVCDDDGIRFSRELVLRQEGYEVESVASNAQLEVSRVRSFDIAVLCHSLDPDRAARVADMLRRYHPAIRVLRVHAMRSRRESYYDVDCEVLPGPVPLLNAIKTLCARIAPASETATSHQRLRRA